MKTRRQNKRERYRVIINELCRLSRDGWRNARPVDYQPLEAEFHKLTRELKVPGRRLKRS